MPDPGITIGPYRILGRTDGKWIVYLDGQPPGQGTVGTPHRTKDEAVAAAKKLVESAAFDDAHMRDWEEKETWEPKK